MHRRVIEFSKKKLNFFWFEGVRRNWVLIFGDSSDLHNFVCSFSLIIWVKKKTARHDEVSYVIFFRCDLCTWELNSNFFFMEHTWNRSKIFSASHCTIHIRLQGCIRFKDATLKWQGYCIQRKEEIYLAWERKKFEISYFINKTLFSIDALDSLYIIERFLHREKLYSLKNIPTFRISYSKKKRQGDILKFSMKIFLIYPLNKYS